MTDRLLLEGWRDAGHSYALVVQHQAIAMDQIGGPSLLFKDLPVKELLAASTSSPSTFTDEERHFLRSLPPPELGDCPNGLYRVCTPFRCSGESMRDIPTLTFMATEMGLSSNHFHGAVDNLNDFTGPGRRIVTSSAWS